MASVMTPNGFALDDSGQRVVVDPICRIEGHLRIEVNLDENNVIRNAVSTGSMWRGLEVILKGRDPRDAWAFTERICGVCTGVHAVQSVRAVEDALNIEIPANANHIRNLMMLAQFAQDHIVHFYHLHALDWVDVVSALSADPKATSELQQSISPWPNSSPGYFSNVQNKLRRFVESGQLGIFANAYWGSPAYKLPPEANLMATTHYLEALDFQKEIVKIHTIFGGRNPHPNWVVGGMPCSINVDEVGASGVVNMVWLNMVKDIIEQTITFTDQVYLPDLKAIASFYKDWNYGGGLSSKNVLAYGEFPMYANNHTNESLMMPQGAILDGDLSTVHDVDVRDPAQIPVSQNRSSNSDQIWSAPKPILKILMRAASTRGSKRRAGAVTRWKSAHSLATWLAMPEAARILRNRWINCYPIWTCRLQLCSRRSVEQPHADLKLPGQRTRCATSMAI